MRLSRLGCSWVLWHVILILSRQVNRHWPLRCLIPVTERQPFIFSHSHTLMGSVSMSLFAGRKSVDNKMIVIFIRSLVTLSRGQGPVTPDLMPATYSFFRISVSFTLQPCTSWQPIGMFLIARPGLPRYSVRVESSLPDIPGLAK